ncbi:von Willebrand factor A [Nitritalea halalkaliphila LW7]|uniref:von Willebrand factor A n=1 Tax=Nitritalea halalkaliphila LW7 TaxID=1189621 RepID=I5C935_9BACT|nr:von Willebrand factor A [Nitritalea halalkaliphila LW7]
MGRAPAPADPKVYQDPENPVLDLSIPGKKTMQNVWTYLRLVPTFYYLLSMILLTVALARPQKTNERVEQYTEGIDIMLVLDISESMDLQDFTPNRLEVVKTVAKDFIRGRVGDRIGIVVFAGEAFSLAPLTTDYELLSDLINDITFNMMDAKGTAIGSAIAAGANRMKEDMENSRVMVLLSDGENNAGNVDPIYAAQLASALDIKIHTIAVGKDGMVPYGQDFFGRPQMIESYLDETTLRDIAELGGGQFFRATENDALDRIFDEIDALEKSEIIESRYKETVDFYRVYLFWGLISFFVWLGLKNTFLNNFLMD